MKKKIFIISFVVVYILAAWHNWNYFNKAFNKGGRWENNDADLGAVLFTFVPVINLIPFVDTVIDYTKVSNKIFNIKKP